MTPCMRVSVRLPCLILWVMITVLALACGGGGGTSSDDTDSEEEEEEAEENEEITDADLLESEVEPTCLGETEAGLSLSSITVTIPDDQIDACANATPALSAVTASSGLTADSETVILSGSTAVQLDLNGDFGITVEAEADDDTDITITLPYTDTNVSAGTEDSLHIYVVAEDQDTGAITPLVGDLNTTSNTITVSTKGLPANTLFTVVYNQSMAAIASDADEVTTFLSESDLAALTAATWPSNVWCVIYDTSNATLRGVVAGILSTTAAALTDAQIRSVIAERVAANARRSGNDYQALGFRAPHLYRQAASAATRACSGTTQSVYFVHMVYSGGSSFQPDEPAENVDTDTLAGFGTKFGRLYVDANRLDDLSSDGLGTVEASVAHEMFHAIQAGYEIYRSGERVWGITEGSAATIGITLDGDGDSTSDPLVRAFASETFPLASYLLNHSAAYRYRNQDFFAYVARAYNLGSFDYLPTYFDAHRNAIVALSTPAEQNTPAYATLFSALETGLQNGISDELTLADVYFDFAVNRLVEHNDDSQFGRSSETTTPGTLATNLLLGTAGLLVSLRGEPDTLSVSKTSNRMGSYSTRVFRVIPTKASDAEDGVKLTVTVTPSRGDIGDEIRVKYYRAGSAAGTEASGESFELRNWGKTTSDQVIVVVSNTQAVTRVNFTYGATTEPEEEEVEENSFEATVEIEGDNIPFVPDYIAGNFGSFSGSVSRTNLPGILAGEGSLATFLANDTILILSDPNDISDSGGTFSVRSEESVFDDGVGAASLTYHTPEITHQDDGDVVIFSASSGTITFTEYSETAGGRLAGDFEINITGDRRLVSDSGDESEATLTGTIEGSFDVELGAE